MTIPREEEPQISVPMVDIRVPAPGLSASDAVEVVAKPLETIIKSIDGVEHVYTQAEDNGVLVTARFLVGSDAEDAATRVDEKINANIDRIPVGIPPPQITVRGIDDVPIVVLTLSPKPGAPGQWTEQSLHQLAARLRTELAKVEDVGLSFIVGGQEQAIRIVPDPALLALHQVPIGNLVESVAQSNRSFPAGTVREGGQAATVMAGTPMRTAARSRARCRCARSPERRSTCATSPASRRNRRSTNRARGGGRGRVTKADGRRRPPLALQSPNGPALTRSTCRRQ